jgi:hypothetical protein
MRLTILVAAAAILTPAVLAASPASAPGLSAASGLADLSAAKKKKKPAAKKEEYLKAAPSAPPSSGKSTY